MGTVHSYHEPRKPMPTLFDDCERCDELADTPWDIDNASLKRLVETAAKGPEFLTENEGRLVAQLMLWARTVARAGITPVE